MNRAGSAMVVIPSLLELSWLLVNVESDLGRTNDVAVASAAAEMSGDRVDDRGVVNALGLGERFERHHDSRRAEPTLESMLVAECGRDGSQGAIGASEA